MSLFGTSPPDGTITNSARMSRSSLFADESSSGGNGSGSALFADDVHDSGSPWSMPTPKKAARHELVKSLLAASDVPDSYIDAYDTVTESDSRAASGISLTAVREILSSSALNPADQAKILNLIVSGGREDASGLSRNEFNVLLALIGLGQEGEDITLDTVDERRKKLPSPSIPYINQLKTSTISDEAYPQEQLATPPPRPARQEYASTPSRNGRESSVATSESDPWGSPELHRGHNHSSATNNEPTSNGYNTVQSNSVDWNSAARTYVQSSQSHTGIPSSDRSGEATPQNAPGWSGYNPTAGGGFGGQGRLNLAGFGPPNDDQGGSNNQSRVLGEGRATGGRVEEVIAITMLPDKEGIFMFQHRNYEVKSARRGSSVVRRYSDFVWLLDCLQKRYPFRQLPLLPPKRVAVNGTHLSADSNSFLEKRRRGLVRFANAVVRHPLLSQEQLVVMFLTVPTELSVWRKQATISVQEEFAGRTLPPDLEDSLPATLNETFEIARSGIKRSADIYINLCNLLERLVKRHEGLAADHLRFSLALRSLTDATKNAYVVDTNDIPLLNDGINATARHMANCQGLLVDEAQAWDEGVLEDLKRQRDCLVSMRDLFERRDRYAKDNIPQLEKRVETNERKLQDLRAQEPNVSKPSEIEKLEDAIIKDKQSIVLQHARGIFIRECIRDELTYFQQSQYHISRLHQDWSQERVKYAELQADNWRGLSEEMEGMPTGE